MSASSQQILLVEDDGDDIFMMRRALKKSALGFPMQVVMDGQEAVNYLAGCGKFSNRAEFPIPSFVFLDLKLPHISGFDVLAWMRKQPHLKDIPVVILTASAEQKDLQRAEQLAVKAYIVKPPTEEALVKATQ